MICNDFSRLFYRNDPPYIGMKCEECFEEIGFILDYSLCLDINDPVFNETVKLIYDLYHKHICKHRYKSDQTCNHCLNPESILTPETCCTGCSRLKENHE